MKFLVASIGSFCEYWIFLKGEHSNREWCLSNSARIFIPYQCYRLIRLYPTVAINSATNYSTEKCVCVRCFCVYRLIEWQNMRIKRKWCNSYHGKILVLNRSCIKWTTIIFCVLHIIGWMSKKTTVLWWFHSIKLFKDETLSRGYTRNIFVCRYFVIARVVFIEPLIYWFHHFFFFYSWCLQLHQNLVHQPGNFLSKQIYLNWLNSSKIQNQSIFWNYSNVSWMPLKKLLKTQNLLQFMINTKNTLSKG